MVLDMKDSGQPTKMEIRLEMDGEYRYGQMDLFMKVIGEMIRLMVEVD